jgi:myo-inositol 2-dehydrogenase/D-chiro-inositol 1-dehydrogenase
VEECLSLYLERWGEAYYLELQEFVNAILENRKPITTAHDGTLATKMGETVQRSYINNELVFFEVCNENNKL